MSHYRNSNVAILALVIYLLFTGCAINNPKTFLGKWEAAAGTMTFDFKENGDLIWNWKEEESILKWTFKDSLIEAIERNEYGNHNLIINIGDSLHIDGSNFSKTNDLFFSRPREIAYIDTIWIDHFLMQGRFAICENLNTNIDSLETIEFIDEKTHRYSDFQTYPWKVGVYNDQTYLMLNNAFHTVPMRLNSVNKDTLIFDSFDQSTLSWTGYYLIRIDSTNNDRRVLAEKFAGVWKRRKKTNTTYLPLPESKRDDHYCYDPIYDLRQDGTYEFCNMSQVSHGEWSVNAFGDYVLMYSELKDHPMIIHSFSNNRMQVEVPNDLRLEESEMDLERIN